MSGKKISFIIVKIVGLILTMLIGIGGVVQLQGNITVQANNYEYAMFPMQCLNISQGEYGSYSHSGIRAIDNSGFDSGKDYFYAPFSGKVVQIYSASNWNGPAHDIIIESMNPVIWADGTIDYVTMWLAHDDDVSDIYVGKTFKQGDIIYQEGTKGYATGNHVHFVCGKGKYVGLKQASSGKWTVKNEVSTYNVLFLYENTSIKNGNGYSWKTLDGSSFDYGNTAVEVITSSYPLYNKGIYKIRNVNSGKLLEVPGSSMSEGVQLQQYSDVGSNNQLWWAVVEQDGYSFWSAHSGMVMDLYGSSTTGGAKITQCYYHGGANQRFKLVHRGDGKYSIHPVTSDLALDVYGYSLDNGALIYQYEYHGDANQLFTFELVDKEIPVISNIQITDVTRDGYTVTCQVTDNIAVERVCFPTWTSANDQDDLKADWYNSTKVSQPVSGNTYSYRVNVSEHNNEGGEYITHIYAYDILGNVVFGQTSVNINRKIPVTGLSFDYIGSFEKGNQIAVSNLVVLPANADDKEVSWSSSNPNIVSVDSNGTITLHNVGTATITGAAANGVSYSKDITVTLPAGSYIGNINSELISFDMKQNNKGVYYLTGQIVVVEWIDGVSTVPKDTPTMIFKSTDGTEQIDVFVTPTGTNTYYFDRFIEGLSPDKEYVFEIASGTSTNISPNRQMNVLLSTSPQMAPAKNLGEIGDQKISYYKASNGELRLYRQRNEYIGHINSKLIKTELVKGPNGNYVSGQIVVVEWVDGLSTVPDKTPIMHFKSVDGLESLPVFVTPTGTNTYYFDRSLGDMDTSKEYIFTIESGNELNVSPYRSMIVTTAAMTNKEGLLWQSDTQHVRYRTDANTAELRIYAVDK